MTREEMLKRMDEIDAIVNDPMFDDMSDKYYDLMNEWDDLFYHTEIEEN